MQVWEIPSRYVISSLDFSSHGEPASSENVATEAPPLVKIPQPSTVLDNLNEAELEGMKATLKKLSEKMEWEGTDMLGNIDEMDENGIKEALRKIADKIWTGKDPSFDFERFMQNMEDFMDEEDDDEET